MASHANGFVRFILPGMVSTPGVSSGGYMYVYDDEDVVFFCRPVVVIVSCHVLKS